MQLSDSDEINSEKVEVQSSSGSEEYENLQLVSDELRPKEDIESRKVREEDNNATTIQVTGHKILMINYDFIS